MLPSSPPYDRAKISFLKVWVLNLISKIPPWFRGQWLYSDNTNDHSHYLAFLPASPTTLQTYLETYLFFWFHSRIKISAFIIKQNYHILANGSENKKSGEQDPCSLSVKLFFNKHFSNTRTERGSKNHSQSRKKGVLWAELLHLCTLFAFTKVSQDGLGEVLTQADFP